MQCFSKTVQSVQTCVAFSSKLWYGQAGVFVQLYMGKVHREYRHTVNCFGFSSQNSSKEFPDSYVVFSEVCEKMYDQEHLKGHRIDLPTLLYQ
jgi:hypothetical protein